MSNLKTVCILTVVNFWSNLKRVCTLTDVNFWSNLKRVFTLTLVNFCRPKAYAFIPLLYEAHQMNA